MTMFLRKKDLIVLGVMFVLGVILYLMDPTNLAVMQSLMVGLFIAVGSHLARRVLFPTLDLLTYAEKAKEEPLAAAIVFTAILVFVISVMWLGISLLV